MGVSPLIEHMAKSLANFHLTHLGGADADTLVPGTPNWHFFTNEAAATFVALRDLPEEPGSNYSMGLYSRANIDSLAEDALREAPFRPTATN